MASPPQVPQPPERRKGTASFTRQFALATELPFLLVGGTLIAGLLGFLLDRWLHTKPFLMLILGAVGFAVSVRDLLRRLDKGDSNGSGSSGQ
jgi:F0F1-type ATP synthase assembly protein I